MEKKISEFTRYLNLPVSNKFLEYQILSHPDYPSWVSISDVFVRIGLRHEVRRISNEQLSNLNFPFLVKSESKDSNEISIVKNSKALQLWFADPVINNSKTSIVLLPNIKESKIVDNENLKNIVNERILSILKVLLIASLITFVIVAGIPFSSWIDIFLPLTSLCGLSLGILLIIKELGFNSKALENFCNFGGEGNCDKIIHSDASKIFGEISLSDAAVSYFLFQLFIVGFLLPFVQTPSAYLAILSLYSIITIPVLFYSFYMQFKLKLACMLCLAVDSILIAQLALFGLMHSTNIFSMSNVSFLSFILVSLLFVGITAAVILINSTLIKYNSLKKSSVITNRFKHNLSLFKQQLYKQKKINVDTFDKEIVLGNQNSPIEIDMIANPGCRYCGKAFRKVFQLLYTYPDMIKIVIRFNFMVLPNLYENIPPFFKKKLHLMNYWIHEVYGKPNQQDLTIQLINDWYKFGNKHFKKFKKKYTTEKDSEYEHTLTFAYQHSEWVYKTGIKTFPTIMINGFKIPVNYNIDDIIALMPGFIQEEIRIVSTIGVHQ